MDTKENAGQLPDTADLQKAIQYTFRNPKLLQTALTHSSYANESGSRNHHLDCNERLEFLGDSVLSIVTSDYLYTHYKDVPEGELTRMRAEVVCDRALSKYAREIGLGRYLLLGHGEDKNNGRDRKSILEDAFEALMAAVYLDAGADGLDTVRKIVLPFIERELCELPAGGKAFDYKTALQQFVQQSGTDVLEYVTVGESGPDHAKVFTVEARLNTNIVGTGKGSSKREAEQNAAHAALLLFGQDETGL